MRHSRYQECVERKMSVDLSKGLKNTFEMGWLRPICITSEL